MTSLPISHVTHLFRHLYREMPPLVPRSVRDDMAHALEHIETNMDLTETDIEQMLINFGKALWPYRKAFQELYDVCHMELGEKLFLTKLDNRLKKRYRVYLEHGGCYADLHSGKDVTFFSEDERVSLCTAFIVVRKEVALQTTQRVSSVDREKYEGRVVEFENILDDMEKRLDIIRQMVRDEQEHPRFAAEMRALIYHFEEGLCLLSGESDLDTLCRIPEHYEGRRYELSKFHR